jgi:hypothetical protein
VSAAPEASTPAVWRALECLLTYGSRTTHTSCSSSQLRRIGAPPFPPVSADTCAAMLNTDDSQPVLPAPVETRTPLDDCASSPRPASSR